MISTPRKLFIAFLIIVATLRPSIGSGQTLPAGCTVGVLPSGAESLICLPLPPSPAWNGGLIVFAHGYVSPIDPIGFYHLTTADGRFVPQLATSLGFAFATTSYRKNGLAILEGVDDVRELVAAAGAATPIPPIRTDVIGVSEGGLVAALLAERSPGLIDGALAMCGPIGSFQGQLDYFGDFRVLFDYFFPDVLPGNAINVPAMVMRKWDTVYVPKIVAALSANPAAALELVRVARAAIDPTNPATVAQTTVGVLWYNVFATNDAKRSLGGNPYDNRSTVYSGSSDDLRLNSLVQRFPGSSTATAAVHAYETQGNLRIPMVTLHTTLDPIVPVWHESLYFNKADALARLLFVPVTVARYGHCIFSTPELLAAFSHTSP
jgi:pimeloyl-ACP methyl ester carboxylesterase